MHTSHHIVQLKYTNFIYKLYRNKVGGDGRHAYPVHTEKLIQGLPLWLSDKESACQFRGHGFDPRSRKIPHTVEQLNRCVTTAEPQPWSPCSAIIEAIVMRSPSLQADSSPWVIATARR